MSLPPERISIKRRRQDEPVDTLILEPGSTHGTKRRFTDFYFQRLRHTGPANSSPHAQVADASTKLPASSNHPVRDYQRFGIPSVKSTAPGDEVNDFIKYKAAQQEKSKDLSATSLDVKKAQHGSPLQTSSSAKSSPHQTASVRRFHLTRDLYSSQNSGTSSTISRHKIGLRPPLATFVEHRAIQHNSEVSIYRKPPVDSIIELKDKATNDDAKEPPTEEAIAKRTQVNTFLKSTHATFKRGISIRDNPATWDQDSDQLANELAALAFDIDPADATEPPHVSPIATSEIVQSSHSLQAEPMIIDSGDDEYVFETYIRVKQDLDAKSFTDHASAEVGILVIDNENVDLWEKYVHSDDDDDNWDDEDEDSNAEDNPRNEYPDDEVSTDDEFGRNVYKYRHNASDDEEFGEEYGDW